MGLKQLKVPSQQSCETAPGSSFHVSEDSGFGGRVGQASASMTVGHRNAGSGASRLYSAGSSLMHRLSRAMRGNARGGLLPQRYTDVAGVHELRLSVRIGIATGWLHYGSNVDNSLVTKRAKCEWDPCWAVLLHRFSRQFKYVVKRPVLQPICTSTASLGCTSSTYAQCRMVRTLAFGMCPATLNGLLVHLAVTVSTLQTTSVMWPMVARC